MKLTPVVLSFNHPELTQRCVESVVSHFPSSAIYLVHNGSQEKSFELLKDKFPQIKHLKLNRNRGYTGGANFGIDRAFNDGAQNVLFVTNDAVVKNVRSLHRPKCQDYILAPCIERRKTGRIDSIGGKLEIYRGRLRHLNEVKGQLPRNFYVPGTAFIVSRSAWEKLAGFDEVLGTYWEDVDLSFRARALGIFLGVAPELTLEHGVGKTCHGNPFYTVYHYHRNRRKVVLRHANRLEKSVFLPLYYAQMSKKLVKWFFSKDTMRFQCGLKALIH